MCFVASNGTTDYPNVNSAHPLHPTSPNSTVPLRRLGEHPRCNVAKLVSQRVQKLDLKTTIFAPRSPKTTYWSPYPFSVTDCGRPAYRIVDHLGRELNLRHPGARAVLCPRIDGPPGRREQPRRPRNFELHRVQNRNIQLEHAFG